MPPRGTAKLDLPVPQRDPSRLSEDLPSETGRPRSSCADTTDTHTFAEDNSAIRGKFGQSTCACRIEDKSEPKRAAGFPFVQPFEPPAATTNRTRAGAEGAMELAVDNGDSSSAPCIRQLGSFFQPFIDH